MQEGRLKKRPFESLDTAAKSIEYLDADGTSQIIGYEKGDVKLDWRLDWPGRWWLQHVSVEPSGRDHMTKGGSYDTGVAIVRDVYEAEPPYPVAYDFINMVGDTKKMSASKGTGLDAMEGASIMPAEVVRYFIPAGGAIEAAVFRSGWRRRAADGRIRGFRRPKRTNPKASSSSGRSAHAGSRISALSAVCRSHCWSRATRRPLRMRIRLWNSSNVPNMRPWPNKTPISSAVN
ncbi:MAG: hypothetical protein WDN27_03485 [Candidatus Saccharibacteria bacterium]